MKRKIEHPQKNEEALCLESKYSFLFNLTPNHFIRNNGPDLPRCHGILRLRLSLGKVMRFHNLKTLVE
jgi:hypothetical protein